MWKRKVRKKEEEIEKGKGKPKDYESNVQWRVESPSSVMMLEKEKVAPIQATIS